MVQIGKTNVNKIYSQEVQGSAIDTSKPQQKTNFGVATTPDSFETKPNGTLALRQIIQEAKVDGKIPMSQNNLNRFLQNNVKPDQYSKTFRDLKGWVSNNFYLTPKQKQEMNSLSEPDVQKMQDAFAQAKKLNQRLSVIFVDPNPESTQAKQLVMGKVIMEERLMSGPGLDNSTLEQSNSIASPSSFGDHFAVKPYLNSAEEKQRELQRQSEMMKEALQNAENADGNTKSANLLGTIFGGQLVGTVASEQTSKTDDPHLKSK